MANFTVRVELFDASSTDYADLHAEMTSRGFSDLITSGGKTYELPPAEYSKSANLTCAEVRTEAKAAADAVDRKSAILVTMGQRCWTGLTQVK